MSSTVDASWNELVVVSHHSLILRMKHFYHCPTVPSTVPMCYHAGTMRIKLLPSRNAIQNQEGTNYMTSKKPNLK